MAARILPTSPLAFAASKCWEASSTARSCADNGAAEVWRSVPLRWKASSSGARKTSHNFCSVFRSKGTDCASTCQRCCRAFTASTRKAGAAATSRASCISAWRRSMLAFCAASKRAAAALSTAFHCDCISPNAFSFRCPALRQRSANWCKARRWARQSSFSACATVQALTSSSKAKRCARWSAESFFICSNHATTAL